MNEIMLGLAFILAGISAFQFWRISRLTATLQALDARVQASQKHLEDEVRMASRGAFGVGKRLIESEKRLGELLERQEQLENIQAAESQSRQAKRILQKTVTEEEPTRNEAKLAAMLKGEAEEEYP